jgi:uncharacterized protein YbjT (DUF2867 family)
VCWRGDETIGWILAVLSPRLHLLRMSDKDSSLRVAVFGATGTAGSAVLRECLSDPRVTEVVAVTRRRTDVVAPGFKEVICNNFLDIEPVSEHLVGLDACFYCLGVSQARVRDSARYREITYDYTLAAAKTILKHSPMCVFHFLTGAGTDPSGQSRMMWARVKGEAEVALASVGLAGVVCWRPGWIHPFHPAGGRHGAWLLHPVFRRFPRLMVSSVEFGRAMLQATFEGKIEGVVENREIITLAGRYGEREAAATVPTR